MGPDRLQLIETIDVPIHRPPGTRNGIAASPNKANVARRCWNDLCKNGSRGMQLCAVGMRHPALFRMYRSAEPIAAELRARAFPCRASAPSLVPKRNSLDCHSRQPLRSMPAADHRPTFRSIRSGSTAIACGQVVYDGVGQNLAGSLMATP